MDTFLIDGIKGPRLYAAAEAESKESIRHQIQESTAKVRDTLARRDSLLQEESAKHQQVMEIQNRGNSGARSPRQRLYQIKAELSELGEQLCKFEKEEYSRLFSAWDEAEKADEMHAAGQASLDSARAKWNDLKFKLDQDRAPPM